MDIFGSKYDGFILFELVTSIDDIFSYINFWRKLPNNFSFHRNQILGIYGQNSRTKRSIDIPNGYNSSRNGMF